MPFATPPFLLHAYTFDQFQITWDENISFATWPSSPAQLDYALTFHNRTIQAATADVIQPARPQTAALLPACFKHCNTEASTFATLLTNGVSLENATVAWYFQKQGAAPSPVPPYIVEQCSTFNCGTDCPTSSD